MSIINLANGNTQLSSGSFPPVRAASTGSPLNPSTGGLLVVDGVQLVAGDRVLCKDEASAVDNGIYTVQTGPWIRSNDAKTTTQFFSGMAVTVALGAVNAGNTFICTCTDDPVVVGTSLITWASQQAIENVQQSATSITNTTIGTGSRTFVTQAGKSFQVGQWVVIYETINLANAMVGQITAYSGSLLTVNVTATSGSGTFPGWTIVLANTPAAAGVLPPLGSGNVTGPGSSTAGHVATFADSTGKVLADGGTPVGAANTILPSMLALSAVAFGAGMLNGKLVASVASNNLTIAVKTLAGADPSSSDPTFFVFRDAAAGYAVIEQTAALSITVPAGATLGTVNGQANRIWVGAFNNGGTPVLGVYNSLNASVPSIVPWDETSPANGTGITSGSTSAQLWYTASTLASKVFRVLGYVESTQATAGQWAASPSKVQLFGPGVKKPGDAVQEAANAVSASISITSGSFAALAGRNVSIPLTSAANMVRAEAYGILQAANTSAFVEAILSRGTVAGTNLFGNVAIEAGNSSTGAMVGYDLPNTAGSVTYAVQAFQSGGNGIFGGSVLMAAKEIQI